MRGGRAWRDSRSLRQRPCGSEHARDTFSACPNPEPGWSGVSPSPRCSACPPAAESSKPGDGGGAAPGSKQAALPDRGHPEGHHTFLLEHHPRRRGQGRARAAGAGDRRPRRVEGPAPRGRSRAADPGRRGLPEPGHQRHRAGAARRPGARPPGRGSDARRHPGRHLRLGARIEGGRQLRRHRQREGRQAGRRAHGQAAQRQGQGPDAALPGGLGVDRGARAGLPRGAQGGVPRRHRDLVRPVRRPDPRHRQARRREPAEPLPGPAGHLLRQRVVGRRHAAGAAGSRPRRQGRLPRLRRPSGLRRGDGRRARCPASSCRTRSRWATSG